MLELRADVTSGRRVIVAAGRARRPHGFSEQPAAPERPGTPCPFCPRNEREAPGEVLAFPAGAGAPGSPGWRVRVVPNRFPALGAVAGDEGMEEGEAAGRGLFPRQPAAGVHEVVVDTPDHGARMGEYPPEQARLMLEAMIQRLGRWRREPWAVYGQLFKNVGRHAGASLPHPHHQLMVLTFVPPGVVQELAAAQSFFEAMQECVFCQLARAEASGARVVEVASCFVVFCPFASRFPYEVWIVPRRHVPRLEELEEGELAELAHLLPRTAARLERSFEGLAYNVVYHGAPWRSGPGQVAGELFHWHVEVLPRLTGLAGFELASGVHVNPTPPEVAAAVLRQA